jgi:NADH:ubiquinone oxidoreductase subunit 3 (subunit A)
VKNMKDKYIKKITVISFIEMVIFIILVFLVFAYYIGTQNGEFLLNKNLNILLIVFLAIISTVILVIKLILKHKRRKWLDLYE